MNGRLEDILHGAVVERIRFRRVRLFVVLCLTVLVATLNAGAIVRAQEASELEPSSTPSRVPTFVRDAPAGALLLQGNPPGVADAIVSDSLMGPGVIPGPIRCPSGLNVQEFVGEGFISKITGRCRDDAPSVAMTTPQLPGLEIPDGEVRLELKTVSGHDRAFAGAIIRGRALDEGCIAGYTLVVSASLGVVELGNRPDCSSHVVLASRQDLRGRLAPDDWNTLAVRLDGPNIWVFLNDELALSAGDATFDRGGLSLATTRIGNLDDPDESAVVFRNFRISALASAKDVPDGATDHSAEEH